MSYSVKTLSRQKLEHNSLRISIWPWQIKFCCKSALNQRVAASWIDLYHNFESWCCINGRWAASFNAKVVFDRSPIFKFETARALTVSNNENRYARPACHIMTGYTGSVCCVVHTFHFCLIEYFKNGTMWQYFLNPTVNLTSHLNVEIKENVLRRQNQMESCVV